MMKEVSLFIIWLLATHTTSFTPVRINTKQQYHLYQSTSTATSLITPTRKKKSDRQTYTRASNIITTKSTTQKSQTKRHSQQHEFGGNYVAVLNDLSKEGTKEAANIAHDILTSLESSTSTNVLNVVHYALVINSFANIGDAESASSILEDMIEKYTSNASDIIPNSHCLSGILKAYIKEFNMMSDEEKESMSSSLGQKCEECIHKMAKLHKITQKDDVEPNTVVYNLLMKAYVEEATSYSAQLGGAEPLIKMTYRSTKNKSSKELRMKAIVDQAIDTLSKMETNHITEDGIRYPKPDSYTYCTMISLLAKCVKDVEAAELAESYLEKSLPYDTASYNAVLLAWSKLGTRYGAERATLLLEKLESSDRNLVGKNEGKSETGPNISSYNTVISAWVKSNSYGDGSFAAEKAEDILEKMEKNTKFQPNVVAYSSIIDCWSRSGTLDGAKRAQKLLEHMEYHHASGENLTIKPNVITYTSVLTAYARTNTNEGAKYAHNLLERMKNSHLEKKSKSVKPNIVSYFAVIDGWARSNSPEAGINAEALLVELEQLYLQGDKTMRPDVRVYSRVIAAHVKCGKESNFESAEKIVSRMESFAQTGEKSHALAKPNVVIYNTLINEYARRQHSRRAMKILNQMDRYSSGIKVEEDKVRADEHTLNGIIYALSIGNSKGKARKALKILERLENSHIHGAWDVKASTRSHNMVINACANSFKGDKKERSEAFTIALSVYNKLAMSSHADVDRFTYISLLKACGKLLPTKSEQRKKYVMEIFTSCCDEGLVDDDILGNFLLASSTYDLPDSIMSCVKNNNRSKLRASMLPAEWTFKAKKTRSFKHRAR